MTRERKITRRLPAFPHLRARLALNPAYPCTYAYAQPIMSLKSTAPAPGYADWKKQFKRRKAA